MLSPSTLIKKQCVSENWTVSNIPKRLELWILKWMSGIIQNQTECFQSSKVKGDINFGGTEENWLRWFECLNISQYADKAR